MRNPQLLFCLIAILFVACSKDSDSDAPTEENEPLDIFEIVDQVGFKIGEKPLSIENRELSVLDELADIPIVGLGEATHGTKEFFQMKHRIFEYLVEEHGFDAILFEMDMAEARLFNDWVQWRSNDDITTLMADKMLFTWVWHTTEVRALFEYMRSYNQGKVESEMIGFYGVDTQFPDYDLLQLVDILRAADIEKTDSVLLINQDHLKLTEFSSAQLSQAQLDKFDDALSFTKQVVIDNEENIRNALGDQELLWAQQLVRHMEQVQENFITRTLSNNFSNRDKFMAENTSWYFDLLGEDSQFVLWAHNGHVENDDVFLSQGYHLKNEYDDDYQIIGFSFAKGGFNARDFTSEDRSLKSFTLKDDPPQNSLNYMLYQSSLDNFILRVKNQDPVLEDWLDMRRTFITIGSGFSDIRNNLKPIIPSDTYDYIIHFDETTSSDILPR